MFTLVLVLRWITIILIGLAAIVKTVENLMTDTGAGDVVADIAVAIMYGYAVYWLIMTVGW